MPHVEGSFRIWIRLFPISFFPSPEIARGKREKEGEKTWKKKLREKKRKLPCYDTSFSFSVALVVCYFFPFSLPPVQQIRQQPIQPVSPHARVMLDAKA